MDPEYFLHRMQWWEAQCYINGVHRRNRTQWTSARWHAWLISKILGGNIDSPKDLQEFAWEITDEEPFNEDEMKALLEECREANKRNAQS